VYSSENIEGQKAQEEVERLITRIRDRYAIHFSAKMSLRCSQTPSGTNV
jgi:hypothetical protein